ncbi:hypothetical protein [Streptomyces iconiensis]|uniref:Uncharacterized protein n=1 Tax=Streptomyces iconiensis TaxID=1384038 RepID=A0ABT7A3G6_9ACTN|nr:hypothetical protein [Streptomyces iconiensis]MDJ1135887.1 hypothetical protein [Streptomyces iconiensis]
MPLIALIAAIALVSFEQLVQVRFGVLGLVGFLLLSIGIKAKHVGCSCAGALVLATLLLQS